MYFTQDVYVQRRPIGLRGLSMMRRPLNSSWSKYRGRQKSDKERKHGKFIKFAEIWEMCIIGLWGM